jgi:hypothetical protein
MRRKGVKLQSCYETSPMRSSGILDQRFTNEFSDPNFLDNFSPYFLQPYHLKHRNLSREAGID